MSISLKKKLGKYGEDIKELKDRKQVATDLNNARIQVEKVLSFDISSFKKYLKLEEEESKKGKIDILEKEMIGKDKKLLRLKTPPIDIKRQIFEAPEPQTGIMKV